MHEYEDFGEDGEAVRDFLDGRPVDRIVRYFGVLHDVIDAGAQGFRLAARRCDVCGGRGFWISKRGAEVSCACLKAEAPAQGEPT